MTSPFKTQDLYVNTITSVSSSVTGTRDTLLPVTGKIDTHIVSINGYTSFEQTSSNELEMTAPQGGYLFVSQTSPTSLWFTDSTLGFKELSAASTGSFDESYEYLDGGDLSGTIADTFVTGLSIDADYGSILFRSGSLNLTVPYTVDSDSLSWASVTPDSSVDTDGHALVLSGVSDGAGNTFSRPVWSPKIPFRTQNRSFMADFSPPGIVQTGKQFGFIMPHNSSGFLNTGGVFGNVFPSDNGSGLSGEDDGLYFYMLSNTSGSAAHMSTVDIAFYLKGIYSQYSRAYFTTTTDVVCFIGSADNPTDRTLENFTGRAVGFQFASSRSDTNWQVLTHNGTTQVLTDTGLTPNTSEGEDFVLIKARSSSGTHFVYWEIRDNDGVKRGSGVITGSVPSDGKGAFVASVTSLAGAISSVSLYQAIHFAENVFAGRLDDYNDLL